MNASVRGLGRGFWKLWTASVLSNLGDGVSVVAYPWLAGTLTRNPVLIAGLAVATRLPWLLVSLPAGAYVDRGDRRRLLVTMDTARLLLTALMAAAVLTGTMTLPLLYGTALLLGSAEVLFDNASQTILPSIVAADRLERANGTLWSAQLVMSSFVGPPLGGLLIGVALAIPFMVDAGSFGASAALVLLIGGAFRARPDVAGPVAVAPRRSLRAEIGEGLRWLWRHRLLRTLALLLGGMNGMLSLTMATEVLFAQEILHLDARGFGVLFTASALGGVLGGQLGPLLSRRLGPGPSLLLTVGVPVIGLSVVGTTSNPVVVGAMFTVQMFLALLWNVITVSLRQTIIPDHLLGRVNSVYRFFGWGMMPLGSLLGGVVVALASAIGGRHLGLRVPFFVAAAAHLAMFLVAVGRLSTSKIEHAKAAAAARDAAVEGPVAGG
jgi:MFS family permease